MDSSLEGDFWAVKVEVSLECKVGIKCLQKFVEVNLLFVESY
jgi:hypothetical protein